MSLSDHARANREAWGIQAKDCRFQWSDGSVAFHLPHGELIALLRRCGFTVEALHELQAPEGATTRYEWVTSEWAHRWPSEEIWVARLDGVRERASAVA